MSSNNQLLDTMIHSLEEEKNQQLQALKAQLHLTGESMKPLNLIKSATAEFTGNKQMKSYLIQAGMGLAVGLLTKKLLSKTQSHTKQNIVGNLAEIGLNKLAVNKLTPKQISIIKMVAPILLSLFLKYLKNRKRKG